MKRDQIRHHYESRLSPGLDSFEVLDWASRAAQEARFEVLARLLPHRAPHRPAVRLLDVGCGLADLRAYLTRRRCAVAYTGVDLTPGILHEANRRHPGTSLTLADVFAAPPFPPQTFDLVFASGVFNLRLGNNDHFLQQALPQLFDLAAECLVVNALHHRATHHYPHCHYYDPETIRNTLAPKVHRSECIDDYLENDFTLVFWR